MKTRHQVKKARHTGENVRPDNLYSTLSMSPETVGQTVIHFMCSIMGLAHKPI